MYSPSAARRPMFRALVSPKFLGRRMTRRPLAHRQPRRLRRWIRCPPPRHGGAPEHLDALAQRRGAVQGHNHNRDARWLGYGGNFFGGRQGLFYLSEAGSAFPGLRTARTCSCRKITGFSAPRPVGKDRKGNGLFRVRVDAELGGGRDRQAGRKVSSCDINRQL